MRVSRRVVFIFLANWMLLLATARVVRADALEDGARELARKIAAALPAGQGIAIDLQSRAVLTPGQEARIRVMLENELAMQGHHWIAVASSAQAIAVRISENLGGYLLVAEIPQIPKVVVMVSVPKSAVLVETGGKSDTRIERELILERPEQILDFGFLQWPESAPLLIVLGLEGPSNKDGQPVEGLGSLIRQTAHAAFPRDMRGWTELHGHQMTLAFPGLNCDGGFGTDSLWGCGTIESTRGDRPGPESARLGHFVPGRNCFRAQRPIDSASGPELGLYFTAQSEVSGGWFATGVDGVARHFDSKGEVTATFSNWGSEIAGINSSCGSGRQLLVTKPGDWTASDSIQAYEISGDQATPVGAALQFAGPVMALWSSGDQSYVRAVVRNLKTGHYEAYRLTIVCGQ